jgi:ribosome-binding factor A
MSRRTEQLSSVIHRAVQSVLSEGLADPRIQGVLTVTGVNVTQDLQEAIIGISVLPEKHESKAIHGLQDASNYIRRQAGELVAIQRMPKLVFKLDRASKRQAAVLAALAEARAESEAAEARTGEPGAGPAAKTASSPAGPGAGARPEVSDDSHLPSTDPESLT